MPKHRHNHVVARAYLNLFSRDGEIVAYLTETGERKVIGTNSAGVRRAFYIEDRDDGTRSTWLETEMSKIESAAVPILREIEQRWPLNSEERGLLAGYMALQAVRGPAWRTAFKQLVARNLPAYQAGDKELSPEAFVEFERRVWSDNQRHSILVSQVAKVGTVFGSMHWSLLRFGSPRLITSDQPVVAVPADARGVITPAVVPAQGYLHMIEYRFPAGPRHLLVMSWLDRSDDRYLRRGRSHQRANVNYSVRAVADKQWFHVPGEKPPHAVGPYPPISSEIHPGYGPDAARESERRRLAAGQIERMIEDHDDQHVHVLEASPAAIGPPAT